ncbi:MAG: hypothetical protein AAGF95_31635 [Chloroflexota bacterium]
MQDLCSQLTGICLIALPLENWGTGEGEITCSNLTIRNSTITNANVDWTGRATPGGVGGQEALSIWGCDGFEVAYNTVNGGTREGIDAKAGCAQYRTPSPQRLQRRSGHLPGRQS